MKWAALPDTALWTETLVVLGLGGLVITAAAALVASGCRRAAWQRGAWRAAVLGLLGLWMLEASGGAAALVAASRAALAKLSETSSLVDPAATPPSAVGAWPPVVGRRFVRSDLGRFGGPIPSRLLLPDLPAEPAPAESRAIDSPAARYAGESPRSWPSATTTATAAAGSENHSVAAETAAPPSPGASDAAAGNASPPLGTPDGDRSGAADPDGRLTSSTARAWPWLPLAVWFLGAALLAARMAWGSWRLGRFRRACRAVEDAALERVVRELAERLGLRREVDVLSNAGLAAPVAFGVARPTVVVPQWFLGGAELSRRQVMLAHELAHLAARDPSWQGLTRAVCALWWWHPAAWWAAWRLRAAAEVAADEASALVPDGPAILADCLVALGRRLARPARLGYLAAEGAGFRSALGRRVERLLSLGRAPWRAPRAGCLRWATLGLSIVLVVGVILSTAWSRGQVPRVDEGGWNMSVLERAWKQSLAAAVVLAVATPVWADPADAPAAPEASVQVAASSGQQAEPTALALAEQPVAPREGEKKTEGDRPKAEGKKEAPKEGSAEAVKKEKHPPRGEGDRKEGEPKEAQAKQGDREKGEGKATRHKEGERKEGERKEGERKEAEAREKEKPRPEKAQPEKPRPEKAQPEKPRPEKPHPEKAQPEKPHPEKAQPEKPRPEKAQPEKSQPEKPQPEKLKAHEGAGAKAEAAARKERIARARQELEARAKEIKAKLEQLRPDQEADARELKGALERISAELRKLEAMAAEAARPEGPPREMIARRIEEVRRELAEARRTGRQDAVEKLERHLHELEGVLERMGRPEGPPPPDRPMPPREEILRKAEETRRQLEEARRAGRQDLVEQLERRLEEIKGVLERMGRPEGPPPDVRGEIERRAQHLRVAIENLRAAGMNEAAERLAAEAERLLRHGPDRPMPRPEPPGPGPEMERKMHDEMRAQMEQMHREMERLRDELRRAKGER